MFRKISVQLTSTEMDDAEEFIPSTPGRHEPFWHEVVRVQFDKGMLLLLAVLLHLWHAPNDMQATAIGGLIVLIQGQRFKFNVKK